MTDPIAEVIESSTRHVVAEVARTEDRSSAKTPDFGAWVEIDVENGTTLYGVVGHVETGSVEPGRRATALGMDRAELRREMPQVLELIRTTFRAQILAYRDTRGVLHQTLPPRPAALHDMVRACSDDTVCALGAPFDYLRTLVRNPDADVPADDLLVALLRRMFRAYGAGEEGTRALLDAGRVLSRLLNDDHERLQSILRRVR